MLNPVAESKGLAALIKKAEEIAARGGKPFATNVRPKAPPGDPRFIGPVQPIGPNQITPQTRIGPPELTTVPERQGPSLPFRTNVRLKAQPETGTGFTMVDTPGQGFTMSPPSRAVAMRDIGSEAASSPGTALATVNPRSYSAPPRRLDDIWDAEFKEIPRAASTLGPVSAADELAFRTVRPQTLSREELLAMRGPEQAAMSSGRPYSGSYLPLFAGTTLAGTALLSGGPQTQNRNAAEEANRQAEINAAIEAARARQSIDDSDAGSRDAGIAALAAQNRMAIDDRDAGARQAGIAQLAAQNRAAAAVRERAAPMPPARPEEFRAQPSGLARFFSGPAYQSKGGELRQDGKINWGDSDNAADFFRADKARMETPDAPGMNRGGAASGKLDKNEAIHRALDIISHLIGHRR